MRRSLFAPIAALSLACVLSITAAYGIAGPDPVPIPDAQTVAATSVDGAIVNLNVDDTLYIADTTTIAEVRASPSIGTFFLIVGSVALLVFGSALIAVPVRRRWEVGGAASTA